MASRSPAAIRALTVAPAEAHLRALGRCDGIDVRPGGPEPTAHDLAWADVVVIEADAAAAALWEPPTLWLIPPDAGVVIVPGTASTLGVPTNRERLATAIRAVAAGLTVRDPAVDAGEASPADLDVETLTPREDEILRLLARGRSNKRIAADLGLSDNTVKYHVSAILAKLRAESRTEAVAVAARRGWLML